MCVSEYENVKESARLGCSIAFFFVWFTRLGRQAFFLPGWTENRFGHPLFLGAHVAVYFAYVVPFMHLYVLSISHILLRYACRRKRALEIDKSVVSCCSWLRSFGRRDNAPRGSADEAICCVLACGDKKSSLTLFKTKLEKPTIRRWSIEDTPKHTLSPKRLVGIVQFDNSLMTLEDRRLR